MSDPATDPSASPAVVDAPVSVVSSPPASGAFFTQGAGKAYQSVSQSMAIAVQDAADGLRNTTSMANTAMGVALAQFLATKDQQYLQAIPPAQGMIAAATTALASVGTTATTLLKAFPSGSS